MSLFATSLAVPVWAVTIETVPVGNPGNPGDSQPGNWGGVQYVYRMGKTEVTVGQYAEFLNAVAKIDIAGLWHPNMATDLDVGRIARVGGQGTYSYSVIGSPNLPVTYVDWGDAARFANWLHNGQPTDGMQFSGTTEDGAYQMNWALNNDSLSKITRKPGATWFLPSQDEWYKSAYHKNDGVTGNYWLYPTSSDAAPLSGPPPGGPNSANYYNSAVYHATEVGAYTLSTSPYGTHDQAANVTEWNELIGYDDEGVPWGRGLLGSNWYGTHTANMRSWAALVGPPTVAHSGIGFRVATLAIDGDANGDGVVDGGDYTIWADHYLQTGQSWEQADFTGEGEVDGGDYTVWADNYAPEAAAASATPEPSTLALAGIGALALLIASARRRFSLELARTMPDRW